MFTGGSVSLVSLSPAPAPTPASAPAPSPTDEIRYLHTLGPTGTNLESAAHLWFRRQGRAGEGRVVLHTSLEQAMGSVPRTGEHALLACAVYPELHTLVFGNLLTCRMVDCFLWPTHEMVFAVPPGASAEPRTVATHPAPAGLVPATSTRRLVTSNAQAAIDCAEGRVEGCVTTVVAARAHGLRVLRSYGEVPMVFTVHHVREGDR
ncbi:bacilysin biosynthesis protein BacA [Streptomyces typhae]|uniref:bacilysin biosynthesis protein BacA n=1 Tax=Streptomyces typhae TaxID=2681492 RepID=UPI001FE9E2F9|nr:bacilysin biosynthesis protein BacA [Streptomyces typhae]